MGTLFLFIPCLQLDPLGACRRRSLEVPCTCRSINCEDKSSTCRAIATLRHPHSFLPPFHFFSIAIPCLGVPFWLLAARPPASPRAAAASAGLTEPQQRPAAEDEPTATVRARPDRRRTSAVRMKEEQGWCTRMDAWCATSFVHLAPDGASDDSDRRRSPRCRCRRRRRRRNACLFDDAESLSHICRGVRTLARSCVVCTDSSCSFLASGTPSAAPLQAVFSPHTIALTHRLAP